MRTRSDATQAAVRKQAPPGAATGQKVPRVQEIMTSDVEACNPTTDLAAAAMVMWRRDCGFLPVVDTVTRGVVGVITDRDICMAVATKGRRASEIQASEVVSGKAHTCAPSDPIRSALEVMRANRVRRLPVVDAQGALTGVLSLNDVVLHARSRGRETGPEREDLLRAYEAICEHLQPV